MNKKQSPPQKKRGATVAAVLCFVAAIAIVGTYTLGNSREARQNEELARTEETQTKDNSTQDEDENGSAEEAGSLVIDNQSDTEDGQENAGTDENSIGEETDGAADENTSAGGTGSGGSTGLQQTGGNGTNINFSEDSKLVWPVNGAMY